MADQTTESGNPKAPQSDNPSAPLAKGEEKNHVPVANERNSETIAADTKNQVAPWKMGDSIRKFWDFIKTPESTNVAMAIATIVIAIATVFSWWEIRSGSAQTDKIVTAAQQIQQALVTQNQQSQEALSRTLRANRRALRENVRQSQAAMDASNNQSKTVLDANIAASRLDQRPWVYTTGYVLSNEPDENKESSVTIGVANSGKTLAFDLVPMAQLSGYGGEPPVPNFTGLKPKSRGLLPPGVTVLTFQTDPLKFGGDTLTAYNGEAIYMYVRIRIEYKDAFKQPHWVTACIYHVHGKPLNEFQYCEDGNDADGYARYGIRTLPITRYR